MVGVGGNCIGWVGCWVAAIGGVGCIEDGFVAVDGVCGKCDMGNRKGLGGSSGGGTGACWVWPCM